MKRFRKNKFVVLIACVIIVSVLYFVIQKAIDNYSFKMNQDIVSEEDGDFDEGNEESMIDVADSTDSEDKNNQEEIIEATEEDGSISNEETDLVIEEVEEEVSEEVSSFEDDANIKSKIYVYITGEVNVPGVVVLNEGSRIVDAINAAGGTTASANVSKVNLVYVLDDGMKVNIPNDNDLKNNPDFEYITMNSGDGGNDDYASDNEYGSSSASSSSGSSKDYSIVNINTATQTELETLPGIGPSLALKIINYRKENGKFSSIEQLKEVSGIGESKFESLKGYVTI